MFGRGILGAGVALAVGIASSASAQESNPVKRIEGSAEAFGQAGQLVIDQDFQFTLTYNTPGADSFTLLLTPGADYFVEQNLSVGAGLNFGQIFQEGANATSIGLNVRVGYNLPYDEKLSFWPKVSAGFVYNRVSSFEFGTDGTYFQIGAFAPVLFHPASHFFVGLGPHLDILLGSGSGFSLGVRSVVGGYF